MTHAEMNAADNAKISKVVCGHAKIDVADHAKICKVSAVQCDVFIFLLTASSLFSFL